MPESNRLFLLQRIHNIVALLALALLLVAAGCGGDARRGGGDDDDDDSASGDDDDASGDDDDTSGDDDDTSSDDDDTSSDDDDDTSGGGTGLPIIQSVDVCEQPNPEAGGPACDEPDFFAQFTIVVSDADGDLQNPTINLSLGGGSPQPQALSGDLGTGGAIGLQVCSSWPRGQVIPYSVSIVDAAGNQSQPFPGSWTVPSAPGGDDCP